jgi:hypothetical protein
MTIETRISTRLANPSTTVRIGAGRPGEPTNTSINRYSDADGALDEAIASLIVRVIPDPAGTYSSEQDAITRSNFDGGEASPKLFIGDAATGEGNDADNLTLTPTGLSAENVATSSAPDVMPALITSVPVSNITIAEGGSAEINGPGTQSVTFTGTAGTLTIDHALAFTGQISGLAGADAIDLADLS